jgi:hypothetical protein
MSLAGIIILCDVVFMPRWRNIVARLKKSMSMSGDESSESSDVPFDLWDSLTAGTIGGVGISVILIIAVFWVFQQITKHR